MFQDRYGLALTTDSAAAAASYRDGMDRMLAGIGGVDAAFNQAIEADSGFALPHAAMARVQQAARRSPEALAAARHAVDLAEQGGADEREREAVAIQHLLVTGQSAAALDRIKTHLSLHPTDAMVLAPASSVFGLIGFSGRVQREAEQLEFLEPLAPHYGDDWWFQSVLAFALVEIGRWDQGRELVQRALELNPASANAAHVLTHALYEAGEDDEALGFLDRWLPDLDRGASLHCHLWWHLCLLLIGSGDSDRAWSLYDRHLAPDVSISPPLNVFTDCASMNWRATLAGEAVDKARWQTLSDYYEDEFDGCPGVFLDAHAALPMVGLGHFDAVDDFVAKVEAMDAEGRLPAGSMAVVMSKAFQAYGRELWGDVIELLEPQLDRVVCIGGSRAQRDLAINTVVAAYARSGRWGEAERLLAGVIDRRPSRPIGFVGDSR